MRRARSKPILDKYFAWCAEQAAAVLDDSPIQKAIQYSLNHQLALCRFLDDGRLPLSNNISERELRREALGRRNWLFVGSDDGAKVNAVFVSLLASCRLHDIEPRDYLRDLLCLLPICRLVEVPRGVCRARGRPPAIAALRCTPGRVPRSHGRGYEQDPRTRRGRDSGGRGGTGGPGAGAGRGGASVAADGGGVAGTSSAGAAAPPAGMRPYKGVANSPCAARTALNVSWYYNWEQTEDEACSDGRGGAFVPMIWGHPGDEQTADGIHKAVAAFVAHGYGEVLGFNEPDNKDQSNIPVMKALELWPAFDAGAIQIGSPGTAANADPGQKWFSDFMKQLNADSTLRADFVAIHWYGWNAGSCDAKASQLESYIKWAEGQAVDRPIWITEWGCLNDSAPDAATVVMFYKAAVAMFAKHPRVERYAWYPWSTNCDLNEKDGSLTELGKAYAAEPAYR